LRSRNFKRREDPREGLVYNELIRAKQVRITREDGSSEIINTSDALKEAYEINMDLLVVSDKSDPPVCKIIEVSKFLYEKKQREKEQARKARENAVEQKEIRMGLNIGQNDIDVKVKNALKMIEKNCKVTLTVTLKGRERGRQDMARKLLSSIAEQLQTEIENFSISGNRVSARLK
jgi:translation initiation factor IF-3